MSVTKWGTYYVRHHGGEETELTGRQSLTIYDDDLRARNRVSLHLLSMVRADRLRRYQTLVGTLHADALSLSSDDSGGGTVYEEFFDDAAVHDDLLVWARINSPAPTLTPAEGAAIRADLAVLRRAIRRARPTQFVTPGQFPRDIAALRHDLDGLNALVSADPTHDALAVSRYVATEVVPDMTPQ